MGYLLVTGNFYASLSRHNSARDLEDNQLWLDFVGRISAISEEEKYKKISLGLTADTEDL